MEILYGNITKEQIKAQKKNLHDAIHWLLIYKDPKIVQDSKYKDVDVSRYVDGLSYRIGGLNELLNHPDCLITILSLLQAVRLELNSDSYNWSTYRKLILDIHSLVDSIEE